MTHYPVRTEPVEVIQHPVRTELVEVRGTLRQAQGERCGMLPFDKLRASGVGLRANDPGIHFVHYRYEIASRS